MHEILQRVRECTCAILINFIRNKINFNPIYVHTYSFTYGGNFISIITYMRNTHTHYYTSYKCCYFSNVYGKFRTQPSPAVYEVFYSFHEVRVHAKHTRAGVNIMQYFSPVQRYIIICDIVLT